MDIVNDLLRQIRDLERQVRALQRTEVSLSALGAVAYSGTPTAGAIAYWTGAGTVAHASFGTVDVVRTSGTQTITGSKTLSGTATYHKIIYASETVTIAGGTATISKSKVLVNGEGGLADDLNTISSGITTDGQVVILSRGGAVTITVKHNSGNIFLDGATDYALNNQRDTLMLIYNATAGDWCEIGRGNNA